jgi:hypothetical protein
MKRFRIIIATAAVGLLGAGAAAHAAGGSDPIVGKQVLDALCIEDKGAPIFTPYAIGRCQEARAKDGYVVERLVCEGLLAGTFTSAPSVGRPNRTNWACIPGAISS